MRAYAYSQRHHKRVSWTVSRTKIEYRRKTPKIKPIFTDFLLDFSCETVYNMYTI